MSTIDLSFCNKSLTLIEKKSTKIGELSDFNQIFSFKLLINYFYNVLLNPTGIRIGWGSRSMIDSRPNGLQLRTGAIREGEKSLTAQHNTRPSGRVQAMSSQKCRTRIALSLSPSRVI